MENVNNAIIYPVDGSSVQKEQAAVRAPAFALLTFANESRQNVVKLLGQAVPPHVPVVPQPQDNSSSMPLAAGIWLAMSAMAKNASAVQDYDSSGLMQLSMALDKQSLNYATAWYNAMGNSSNPWSDFSILLDDANSGTGPDGVVHGQFDLQADNAKFTMHSTEANNATTFFSGLNNGVNDNSSNTTQTISLNIQNQQTLQQTFVTITNAI